MLKMIQDNVDFHSSSNDPDSNDVPKRNKIQAARLNISDEDVDYNTAAPPSESIQFKNDYGNFNYVPFKDDKDNLSFTKSPTDQRKLTNVYDQDYLGQTHSTST